MGLHSCSQSHAFVCKHVLGVVVVVAAAATTALARQVAVVPPHVVRRLPGLVLEPEAFRAPVPRVGPVADVLAEVQLQGRPAGVIGVRALHVRESCWHAHTPCITVSSQQQQQQQPQQYEAS